MWEQIGRNLDSFFKFCTKENYYRNYQEILHTHLGIRIKSYLSSSNMRQLEI